MLSYFKFSGDLAKGLFKAFKAMIYSEVLWDNENLELHLHGSSAYIKCSIVRFLLILGWIFLNWWINVNLQSLN